jgi:hypothetical protein
MPDSLILAGPPALDCPPARLECKELQVGEEFLRIGANIPSRTIIGKNWGVKSAQYSNNTCVSGCSVTP